MKRISLLVIILIVGCVAAPVQPPAPPAPPKVLSVYFSSNGGCTKAIVKELDNAKTSILVQAYSFTSAPFVAKAGIPVKIDSAHEIAHNKIMIIDGETVITGSSISPRLQKIREPINPLSFGTTPWPRNTSRTGRSMRGIRNRIW